MVLGHIFLVDYAEIGDSIAWHKPAIKVEIATPCPEKGVPPFSKTVNTYVTWIFFYHRGKV